MLSIKLGRLGVLLVCSSILSSALANIPPPIHRLPVSYNNELGQQFAKEFELNSTVVSDDRQMALLNGQLVQTGDEIRGSIVTKIMQQAVVLNRDGQLFTVRIKSPSSFGIQLLEEEGEPPIVRAKPPWKQD